MLAASNCEMTTTSIASSGAGAVTCIPLTDIPAFSDIFGSAAVNIPYIIREPSTGKYEEGYGSVAADVLTRSLPMVTYDGTTYNALSPSALTFSASPSSGDVRIRIGISANMLPAIMTARQSVVAGDATWRDYPLSADHSWAGNGVGYSLTADREYLIPYRLTVAGVLSGIQFEVTTLQASSNLKMALYGQSFDGGPGKKILDFVTTATTSTGVKTDTASASWTPAGKRMLIPSRLWIGIISGHAIGIRVTSAAAGSYATQSNSMGRKDAYGWGTAFYKAGSYATGLPAAPTLSGYAMESAGLFNAPWIGLKVV